MNYYWLGTNQGNQVLTKFIYCRVYKSSFIKVEWKILWKSRVKNLALLLIVSLWVMRHRSQLFFVFVLLFFMRLCSSVALFKHKTNNHENKTQFNLYCIRLFIFLYIRLLYFCCDFLPFNIMVRYSTAVIYL